ncbi:hypothetical protein BT93_I0378 [Corymbia citriodora subsp. variegata]|nr:hypothetical protein BT93_I0378 [Corymbia citriodora subsp. variegata]
MRRIPRRALATGSVSTATVLIIVNMLTLMVSTTCIALSRSVYHHRHHLHRYARHHSPPKKSFPCPLWSSSFSFCLQSPHKATSLSLSNTCPSASAPPIAPQALPVADACVENNPLLQNFEFPPFDVEAKHVCPGILALLKKLESNLEELARIVDQLDVVSGMIRHLKAVKDTVELRAAIEEVQAEEVKFELRLEQSKPIYNAFKALQESPDWNVPRDAQKRIVENQIKGAVLNEELEKLSSKFAENVLDATKEFEKLITDKKDMEGLPATPLGLAAQTAVSKGHKNATPEDGPWVITLDAPSYNSIMQHARNRALREEIYRAYVTRASSGDLDNTLIIDQILKLRLEQAKLEDYNNYAELRMAMNMATVDKAEELLEKLRSASCDAAGQDMEDLKRFAKSQGAKESDNLRHWDIIFWSERLRESKFDISEVEEELRQYFSLPNVMEGLFNLARTLFEIEIEAADGLAPVWNKDVRFYCVKDSLGNPIAYFYFDPYSRPSEKHEGAWMGEVVGQSRALSRDGVSARLPIVYIVCDQTPPVGNKPSLMTFEEVKTVFHEFGHALQHMLTRHDEGLIAGSGGIVLDAVELPSQFMENWCYHRETLMGIAKHYETGESLPEDVYRKLLTARTFLAGTSILSEIRFASVDLQLHTKYVPGGLESVYDVDRRVCEKIGMIPPPPEDRFLCTFDHIFAGKYAAGYYGYKWAEVLSADAFSAFEDAGLNDSQALKETGQRFRETILALGGGKDPLQAFIEFRGREPSLDELLRHNGLLLVVA